VELQSAAEINGRVFFRHFVRIAWRAQVFDGAALALQSFTVVLQDDDVGGLSGRRSPVEIILVRAPGMRQAALHAERINGTGFAVVARNNDGALALFGRQRKVSAGDDVNDFRPAEAV